MHVSRLYVSIYVNMMAFITFAINPLFSFDMYKMYSGLVCAMVGTVIHSKILSKICIHTKQLYSYRRYYVYAIYRKYQNRTILRKHCITVANSRYIWESVCLVIVFIFVLFSIFVQGSLIKVPNMFDFYLIPLWLFTTPHLQ